MEFSRKRAGAVLAAFALMGTHIAAHADVGLLTAADEQRLASWLGESHVSLKNVFTKQAGSTAADFHASADGKGRTIVVMEATNKAGQSFLLGGYNPQAWASSGGYSMTDPDSSRTAFLFNLSTGRIHRQMLNVSNVEALGSYQALNEAGIGPTFGWGHDLQMSGDLTTGYSLLYSYADASLSDMNLSIADGLAYRGMDDLHYGRVEVYTISAVPEPAQVLLLAAGLGALLVARRRG